MTCSDSVNQILPEKLTALSAQAASASRKRANHNLHPTLEDPVQRLLIAMEPGTYVRPHRHPSTFELLIPLRGEFVALYFDDRGVVTARSPLGGDSAVILEHRPGRWHSVISLKPGSVIFEVKTGPYQAVPASDFAPWSPEEGNPEVSRILQWFTNCRPGERYSA